MLTGLANMPDGDEATFWMEWRDYYQYSHDDLQVGEYRDRLRLVWRDAKNGDKAGSVIDGTLRWLVATLLQSPTGRARKVLLVHAGKLHVNLALLPLAVAAGISERSSKMALCANPECHRRYFLRERSSDRFCGNPVCANFGQREKKRKWWAAHGKEWRSA